MPADVSLAIQAGGNSRRMGEDKGRKLFLGRPLVTRVMERVSPVAAEIMVTTNHPADYAFVGRCLVPDLIPGRGALGGLYTALSSALFPVVAVVACDMPFASAALFTEAIRIMVAEEMDVVIPHSESGLEPLHAVYRRSTCLPEVLAAIRKDQFKVISFFPAVRVREMSPDDVAKIDPSGLAFRNVNTPEDFEQAERLARSIDAAARQADADAAIDQ
jgi:molybdopterin-guanine dinucleotide biosynthesis protein A